MYSVVLLIALELKRAFALKGYLLCVCNELGPGNLTGMTRNEERTAPQTSIPIS